MAIAVEVKERQKDVDIDWDEIRRHVGKISKYTEKAAPEEYQKLYQKIASFKLDESKEAETEDLWSLARLFQFTLEYGESVHEAELASARAAAKESENEDEGVREELARMKEKYKRQREKYKELQAQVRLWCNLCSQSISLHDLIRDCSTAKRTCICVLYFCIFFYFLSPLSISFSFFIFCEIR